MLNKNIVDLDKKIFKTPKVYICLIGYITLDIGIDISCIKLRYYFYNNLI